MLETLLFPAFSCLFISRNQSYFFGFHCIQKYVLDTFHTLSSGRFLLFQCLIQNIVVQNCCYIFIQTWFRVFLCFEFSFCCFVVLLTCCFACFGKSKKQYTAQWPDPNALAANKRYPERAPPLRGPHCKRCPHRLAIPKES